MPMENLWTRFGENPPDSERGDQRSLCAGTPLSGRHHQGRMRKRLSARFFVEVLNREEALIQRLTYFCDASGATQLQRQGQ